MIGRCVVTLNHAGLGGTGTNTWHVRSSSDHVATINALMGHVQSFYSEIMNLFPDSFNCEFDGEFHGVGADEGEFLALDDWMEPGTTAGGILPPSQCVVVGWRTTSGGRSGIGRTFLSPMHANCLESNGTIVSAVRSQILGAAQDLVDESAGLGNGALGVYSRQDNVLRDFLETRVRGVFGSLRSRRD